MQMTLFIKRKRKEPFLLEMVKTAMLNIFESSFTSKNYDQLRSQGKKIVVMRSGFPFPSVRRPPEKKMAQNILMLYKKFNTSVIQEKF